MLTLGRGVCQDFAHVLIAACRSKASQPGTSAATSTTRCSPAQHVATHAWVDVWNDDRGWISLDPTHRREQNECYVRVAVGRDYGDVPPTRGVFKGQATETLSVAVAVAMLPSSSRRRAETYHLRGATRPR